MFAAFKNLVGGGDLLPYDCSPDSAQPVPSGSIWTLQAGTSKQTKEPVSIFSLELTSASPAQADAGRNAQRRLKTLRHPNVLRFIESVETPTHLYLVTEPVVTLQDALRSDGNEAAMVWGIYQIVQSLKFIVDCDMVHGNVCLGSVFVTAAGEWKLGGLDALSGKNDPSGTPPVTWEPPSKYHPAEKQTGRGRSKKWSTDMWGFGCLLWEVYNGELGRPEQLKNMGKMPKTLIPHYVALVSANPATRPSPSQFLEDANKPGHYLKDDFVDTNLFLEEFAIKEDDAKARFFKKLPDMIATFPKAYTTHKILPQLLNAFQFAGAGSGVLPSILRIGNILSDEEYKEQIVPIVVKLFSSPDRMTRINLLKQLDQFVKYLSQDVVTKDIFPHVAAGFTDTVPALREQTLKAMLFLAPKLSREVIDSQLLGHFAKLQKDEQPGIRTNTTICLGKLGSYLNPATRSKVLSAAFTRATKDSFTQARLAGINAMTATCRYLSVNDIATKIIPGMSPLTIDPEKSVRDQTFTLLNTLLEKLKKSSAGELEEDVEDEPIPSTAGSGWAGWASSAVDMSTKLLKTTTTAASSLRKTTNTAPATEATDSAPSTSSAPQQEGGETTGDEEEWEEALEQFESPKLKKKARPLKLGKKITPPRKDKWESDGIDAGWGSDDADWSTGLEEKPASTSQSKPKKVDTSWKDDDNDAGDAWGDDGWGDDNLDLDDDVKPAPKAKVSPPKQPPAAEQKLSAAEAAKKRREERKAMRLQARAERASSSPSRPKKSGLGAVRKIAKPS